MEGKLLTVKDVATRLQISVYTVYRLYASNKLHGRKLGKRILRFTEEDITRYLEKNNGGYYE